MRIMYYEMKLSEWGYIIASCAHFKDYDSLLPTECLPLRVAPSGNMGALAKAVEIESTTIADYLSESGQDKVPLLINNVICGADASWMIYSLRISCPDVVFECYNYITHEIGTIVLRPTEYVVELQISVPHKTGRNDSNFSVVLMPDQTAPYICVTELLDGVKREFTFRGDCNSEEKADQSETFVSVAEYIDL